MHQSPDSFDTRVRRALGVAVVFLAVVAGLPVGLWSADAALEFTSPVREGGQLRLRWTGGAGPFQLEESGSPGGPWVARGGPTAEFSAVVPMEHGERYFRVAGAGGLSPEEASMRATLVAIDDFAATVPTADRAVWRSRMLAFLKARSDINEAGESPDGLWAITNDGIPLAFWNNRNPDPPGGDAVPGVNGRSGSETPGASPARLAATVGEGFTLATPRLGRLLRRHHYTTTEDTASLESLKGTRNESLFFINTHGGLGPRPQFSEDGQPVRGPDGKIKYDLTYALWSGTAIDPRKTDFGYSHNEFVSELRAGRLALVLAVASYATGTGGLQSERREWRFGITDAWVRHYLRFPERQHTSIWLAACRSGSADAAALRSAFRSAGAEMVSSWTEAVTGEGIVSATPFLFDRLLGANEIQPPATPQRPFSYPDVWTELRARGLHRHPTANPGANEPATSDIIYEGATGEGTFGLFAPSLAYVLVDEGTDRLHLIGLFGNPPEEERKILIGGVECQNGAEWTPRRIICPLPQDGPGSHGDVQVVVRGRRSNVRQLSRWTLTGEYRYTEFGSPFGIDGTMKFIFRADIGEYRKVPGNVFIRPTRYAYPGARSEIILRGYGTETEDCGEGEVSTTTWSGRGPYPALTPGKPPGAPWHTIAGLVLNTIDNQAGLGIAFGALDPTDGPVKYTYTPCDGPPFVMAIPPVPPGSLEDEQLLKLSTEETLPDGTDIAGVLPGKTFPLSPGGVLAAATMENEPEASFTWSATAPESPPDPEAAR